jgi:hypothetical protein
MGICRKSLIIVPIKDILTIFYLKSEGEEIVGAGCQNVSLSRCLWAPGAIRR